MSQDVYPYHNAEANCAHAYLAPTVLAMLARKQVGRILDLGCGNGSFARLLCERGWQVTGLDLSASGVATAKRQCPDARFAVQDITSADEIVERFGRFPVIVSLEVIEHMYSPRAFAESLYALAEPGGEIIVSTPYHGYLKNLALALTGKMDAHFTALWEGGHIKFFSPRTLRQLFEQAGFSDLRITRVGRVPPLAKSMILHAKHP